MGDVARQTRQQKQSKDAQSKAAPASKSSKVITNDEIPESPDAADGASSSESEVHGETSAPPAPGGAKQSAEQWKSQILAQKATVSSLQSNIDKLNDSIQFAPDNCVAGCVQVERTAKAETAGSRADAIAAGNTKETLTDHVGIRPPARLRRDRVRSVEMRVVLR